MKFGFVTCVQLGLSCMEEIYKVGGKLELVITLHDELATQKSGRVYVDQFCAAHDVAVLKVKNVNDDEALAAIRERELDWLFIIGWSQIARRDVLSAPRRGVLGMHPTLLPTGRGRAAIPWAIIRDLSETGVTLFQLDEGVDTGPIIAQQRLPLASDETATTLYERVTDAHASLIGRVWPDLMSDRVQAVPQQEEHASVWEGRKPADGRLSAAMSVAEVERLVRATTRPYPGAFWQDNGTLLRVWQGRVGDPAAPPEPGVRRLYFSDGAYDVLHYDLEPAV
ncbi:MAG TPA: formyltransferase family protein [Pyrinomonadaceae bacterium]|nr:formyltransferase family protein [Pyrinomonadaceae bacterium]